MEPLPVDPQSRILVMLDEVMDRLMVDQAKPTDKGEAIGLAKSLSVISCLSVDEVREYAMYRWEARTDDLEPMRLVVWATS